MCCFFNHYYAGQERSNPLLDNDVSEVYVSMNNSDILTRMVVH